MLRILIHFPAEPSVSRQTPSEEFFTESLTEERLSCEEVGLEEGLLGDWDLTDASPPAAVPSSSHAADTLGLRSAALSLDELSMLESDCVARSPTESWEDVALKRDLLGEGSFGGDPTGGDGLIP